MGAVGSSYDQPVPYWPATPKRLPYALLLSCASSTVNGPDLVCRDRHPTARAAYADGTSIARASGLEFAVMHQVDGTWRDVHTGRTAVETIRARWGT